MENQAIYQGPMLTLNAMDASSIAIIKSLASTPRLRILELLSDRILNVSEIAEALKMPLSTANLHISSLEEAGLLLVEMRPGVRGLQKSCARAYESIFIQLPKPAEKTTQALEINMPIGAFVDSQVAPTCGIAGQHGIIGLLDDASSFYEPERINAQLLWFSHGHVEYRFPKRLPPQVTVESLQFTMEICSEAPLHHEDWPSDITLWVNDVEVGTWTCPQDFGGQRGALTPEWWESYNTQFGLLKAWQITQEGSFIDGIHLSGVTLQDLGLGENQYISMRIGIREDAQHIGGLNLFGRHFGNYPQDIIMRMRYR